MKKSKYIRWFLLTPVFAALALLSQASDLPTLKVASQIRTGVLDNGVAYYMVVNPTEKGVADIALVQKVGYADEDSVSAGVTTVHPTAVLTELPHFKGSSSPLRFLGKSAIWPAKEGYVTVRDDATIYRFSDLVLSKNKDIVDSTLLLVFDIIASEPEYLQGLYAPSNQAIVISGDIDATAVLSKMNMLSLLVPKRPAVVSERKYSWKGTSGIAFEYDDAPAPGLVSVTAEYATPRAPRESMNTVLPLVTRKFTTELGILLKKRLGKALRQERIPVYDLSVEYVSSADQSGDEKFRITIGTSEEMLEQATRTLASTLADLDTYGSVPDEYKDAENEMVMAAKREYTGDVITNSSYIDLCASSYLYGSSMADAETSMNFFLSRNLQNDVGVKLFNNYVFALLDRNCNLTLRCAADSSRFGRDFMVNAFDSAWRAQATASYTINNSDTLGLRKPSSKAKTKLRTVGADPLSGGEMWTFDNGIKVIYKKVANTGMFHYMWLLRGGYAMIPNLKDGESAYVSDIFGLYDVAGMDCYDFRDMLAANGITMNAAVTVSDCRIGGAAPSSRFSLLMKSLYSLASGRSLNQGAYDYYRECEALGLRADRESDRGGLMVLDSMLFQGSGYAPYKKDIRLLDDLPKRAGKYFDSEFSKMNDGVLILVGDLDDVVIKKELTRVMGSFKTENVSSFRSKSRYKSPAGVVFKKSDGGSARIELGFSAPLDYSSSNYLASYVALAAFRNAINTALVSNGWYSVSSSEFMMFPEERLNVTMSCGMADPLGMPASLERNDSTADVISQVRSAIVKLGHGGIDNATLNAYKTVLAKTMESRISSPDFMISLLILRYSYGKDLITKYKEKISGISLQDVNDILSDLAGARRAEYAVQGRPVPFVEHPLPDMHYPEILAPDYASVADSIAVSAYAFRALGVSDIPEKRMWLDNGYFRDYIKTLPKPKAPAPIKLKPRPEVVTAPADSLTAVDSTATPVSSADSLKLKQPLDSLVLKMPAADSLKMVADTLKNKNYGQ